MFSSLTWRSAVDATWHLEGGLRVSTCGITLEGVPACCLLFDLVASRALRPTHDAIVKNAFCIWCVRPCAWGTTPRARTVRNSHAANPVLLLVMAAHSMSSAAASVLVGSRGRAALSTRKSAASAKRSSSVVRTNAFFRKKAPPPPPPPPPAPKGPFGGAAARDPLLAAPRDPAVERVDFVERAVAFFVFQAFWCVKCGRAEPYASVGCLAKSSHPVLTQRRSSR